MSNPLQGRLLDIVKGSSATLALFLVYAALPLAGIIPGLFVPLPAIYGTLKNGKVCGLLVVGITTVVLAIVTGPQTAAFYLLQNAVISLAIPVFLMKGMGGARVVVSTVACAVMLLLVSATLFGLVRGVDVHRMVMSGINGSISEALSLYERSGLKGEELEMMRQGMKQGGELIARLYPSIVLICLGMIAGLNLRVVARMAARLPHTVTIGEFRNFRNTDHLIWGLIVAGFALLLPTRIVTDAALNALVVVVALYFLQGLAIVIHFFSRIAVPRLVRWIFYSLLALQPYLMVAVAVLGIFDLWGNFRTPRQRENL